MKPKLMIKDAGMEDHLMFFYPDDNFNLNMQGCLNKNTLIQHNVSSYITVNIVKVKDKYRYSIYNMKGKEVYFELSKRSIEEKLTKLPVAEYLIKAIQGEI